MHRALAATIEEASRHEASLPRPSKVTGRVIAGIVASPTPSRIPPQQSYEAIVVGSGFGGSVAACRLAQAGVSVAILERGRRFEPGSFPRPAHGRHDLMHWSHGGPYDIRPLNESSSSRPRAMEAGP